MSHPSLEVNQPCRTKGSAFSMVERRIRDCGERPHAPDFAVVGAPKCGTTSLYDVLKKHPGVFLPRIKEPNYFVLDRPRVRNIETASDYNRLFRGVRKGQICGDMSTLNLWSAAAIPAMLDLRPALKVIAIVRDPIDLFVSWHNEQVKGLNEDQRDPERAWDLQEARAQGHHLPPLCAEPALVQYKAICSLGEQIRRVCDVVPKKQRLLLVFEDFQRDPQAVCERILEFLEVSGGAIGSIPRENGFAQIRSVPLARVARVAYQHPAFRSLKLRSGPLLDFLGIRPLKTLIRWNLMPVPKPILTPQFLHRLSAEFSEDAALLQSLMPAR